MIFDARNTFAEGVSCAAAAGTALIGDVIDLGAAHRDVGAGQDVFLVISVNTEIFTAGAAGTVKFQLCSDSIAAIHTDGSATVHFDSGNFTTGATGSNPALKGGAVLAIIRLPNEGPVYKEFLGVLCVTGTTTTTSGKINAFLTLDPQSLQVYKEGVN